MPSMSAKLTWISTDSFLDTVEGNVLLWYDARA